MGNILQKHNTIVQKLVEVVMWGIYVTRVGRNLVCLWHSLDPLETFAGIIYVKISFNLENKQKKEVSMLFWPSNYYLAIWKDTNNT